MSATSEMHVFMCLPGFMLGKMADRKTGKQKEST